MVVPASQVVVVVDSNQFGLMDAAFCLFGRPHVCPSENLVQLTRLSIDVSGSAISDVFGGARCHVGRIDVDVG